MNRPDDYRPSPMWGRTPLLAVLMLSLCPALIGGAAGTTPDRIETRFNERTRTATIAIQTPNGNLRWSDLLRGLARAKGFDDEALTGLLPDETVSLDSVAARLTIVGVSRALGDGIDMSLEDGGGAVSKLIVKLDEQAVLESQRRLKARLRAVTVGAWRTLLGGEPPQRGLRLPDGWPEAATKRPLVIFVHGLDSDADRRGPFLADLRDKGWPVGTFAYRNDGPIQEAGEKLAAALRELARTQEKTPVALVTWSMGGLVARAAIEDPRIAPGNVERLIMVAPPNHGSQLARFAFGLDVLEHLAAFDSDDPATRLFHLVEDGLGEASVDLQPDSAFLRKLNARDRNENVAYSILLGAGGPLSKDQRNTLRRRVKNAGEDNRYVRFFGPKVDRWLADLDEVVAGKGDGAVAIKRGKLEGVEDVATLPFDHVAALQGPGATGVEAKLRKAVIERLSGETADR